jgi:hypothetical protein
VRREGGRGGCAVGSIAPVAWIPASRLHIVVGALGGKASACGEAGGMSGLVHAVVGSAGWESSVCRESGGMTGLVHAVVGSAGWESSVCRSTSTPEAREKLSVPVGLHLDLKQETDCDTQCRSASLVGW